jgi:hypothetical protein
LAQNCDSADLLRGDQRGWRRISAIGEHRFDRSSVPFGTWPVKNNIQMPSPAADKDGEGGSHCSMPFIMPLNNFDNE